MNLVLVARSTGELNALSTRLYAKYKVQRTVLSIDLADPSSPQMIPGALKQSLSSLNVAVLKWIFSSIMRDSV